MTNAAVTLPPGYSPESPAVKTTSVDACPVCGSTRKTEFSRGYDFEMETCSNEWIFVECSECGCVWLDPRPDVSELGTIYPETYYSYALEDTISPIAVKGKEFLDKMKFGAILKALDKKPESFLDIGCGDGRYLKLFAAQGLSKSSIYGLELSQEPVDRLNAQGFQTYCERVEDSTHIPDDSIDLATMFHVIEHVDDPGAVIARIYSWLKPGGVLALETPNLSALDARMFKKRWWGGYHIPRHWTLFNEDTLSRLLQKNGFEISAIKYQTGHSFWMYSFHHWLRYNAKRPMPRLSAWFDPLKGLPFLIGFTGFDTLRRLLGIRTSAMLILARKPNETS